MSKRTYIAIDLKSFYASVECADRHLNPLTTNLVVADTSRTEKTICLAVSPALKAYGIGGRARLFEVLQKVKDLNRQRLARLPAGFQGASPDALQLSAHADWAVKFIAARPRMARYLDVSAEIYGIYLQYFAPEDMHVYSIDEVFIDITNYLRTYQRRPEELARHLIEEILERTGITATAGIGTNLYLCKVALDIEAKKTLPDENGVRIAALDEPAYRRQLWTHRPLTDFWRIGRGIASRLHRLGVETMGDLARTSLNAEDQIYWMFGKNAELLIDHAWGYEPCTMADIKSYRPAHHSLSTGQVLHRPYESTAARLVAGEMADELAMELTEKQLVTDQVILTVSYDAGNLRDPDIARAYTGPVHSDFYGRTVPKHAHGSENLSSLTASRSLIREALLRIFDRVVDPMLLVRRITVCAGQITDRRSPSAHQLSFLTSDSQKDEQLCRADREQKIQAAAADLRGRFGRNVLFHAVDLAEGATAIQRNQQIGGHRA